MELSASSKNGALCDPLVSIVLPTYGRDRLLTQAIESVVGQTYPNLELIVVSDGSPVDVAGIVSAYDHRVRLVTHPANRGLSCALNTGLREAKGSLLGILADDDLYEKRKIETQVDFLRHNPGVDVLYTEYQYLYPDGYIRGHPRRKAEVLRKLRSDPDILRCLLLGNFVDAISPLVRTECYQRVGGFDERLSNLEDWDMWIRMAVAGCRFAFLDETLALVRRHEGSKSNDALRDKHARLRVLHKAFGRGLVDSEKHPGLRNRAYARVFMDFANLMYKAGRHRLCSRYYRWSFMLDPRGATPKAFRRMIVSAIRALAVPGRSA